MSLDRFGAIYVDVDGTLLIWPGEAGRVPRPGEPHHGGPPAINVPLVEQLKAWHRAGRALVFWSRNGTKHCQMAARLTGLKPLACLPKPNAAIDDGPRSVTAGSDRGFVVLSQHPRDWS